MLMKRYLLTLVFIVSVLTSPVHSQQYGSTDFPASGDPEVPCPVYPRPGDVAQF